MYCCDVWVGGREQAGAGVGRAGALVQRGHGVGDAVDALDASWLAGSGRAVANRQGRWEFRKGLRCSTQTGLKRVALRDVRIAEDRAHHGAVPGLGQGVGVAVARVAARALGAQLVEQAGHAVVDVLAAVVGVEAQDADGALLRHLRDDGQQVGFGEGLHRGHHLRLRDAVKIALVHAMRRKPGRPSGAGARRRPMVAVRSPRVWVSDPPIPALIVRGGAELQRLRAVQNLPHLRFVHVDHPRQMIDAQPGCPSALQPPPGSHRVGQH